MRARQRGHGGAGERGMGGSAGFELQRHLGWCRRAWQGRQCWVRAAAPPGVVQASVAREAVLGRNRSATWGGAGERGKGGSAGLEAQRHLWLARLASCLRREGSEHPVHFRIGAYANQKC